MDFRIADTFTDSMARLTGEEQKAVKMTAFDLQLNPASPGLSFHKLDRAKDRRFWSVRVNDDIRIIVHRDESSLMLCYVDHHDRAYAWAERRRLETHPRTGAAQIVEIRERVQEVVIPVYVTAEAPAVPDPAESVPLFSGLTDEQLLACGVPHDWLPDVRLATESTLYGVAEHLPAEASEALFDLATGGKPKVLQPAVEAGDPFGHPDARRRFRVMTNVEELERALEYPWDKWTIFLHPEQHRLVVREYGGPARVAGSAGTGKTIVALHRAVHLARSHPDARVLLTTFSDTLASALQGRLKRLLGNEPRLGERIDVHSLESVALRLYRSQVGPVTLASDEQVRHLVMGAAAGSTEHRFSPAFLRGEWEHVVDAWQLESWEEYRDVARLGRKVRLPEAQRRKAWDIFSQVRRGLAEQGWITRARLFTDLAAALSATPRVVFDFAVIDEAQDLGVAQLRFLAALGGGRSNALFFAGDLGQRIFQQPFSWKSLGVDVRGRSHVLRVNYRTSHQIRAQADRLLGPSMTDVDGITEDRTHTVSVFNGPSPVIRVLEDEQVEIAEVGRWLAARRAEGIAPHEVGVFVRSGAQMERAMAAARAAEVPFKILDEMAETTAGHLSISTMHLAKGLEFRVVAVMACDDEVVPLQARIEAVGDGGDLQEIYDTERQLLYVACTRARDQLLVTGVAPASEFLDDMAQLRG